MIPDLTYTNRTFYIFNQVRLRPTYILFGLNTIDLHIRGFCYLVNILTSIKFIIGLMVLIKLIFV